MAVNRTTEQSMALVERARTHVLEAGRRVPAPLVDDVLVELTQEQGIDAPEARTAVWDALTSGDVGLLNGSVIVTRQPVA